jgi:hypothetical protein
MSDTSLEKCIFKSLTLFADFIFHERDSDIKVRYLTTEERGRLMTALDARVSMPIADSNRRCPQTGVL